jgi:organic radical activating enzyme|tara:strand:+ start:16869 stop:17993 length:1125 start_codon:yes stop_codon:yes gene_type:complete
MSHSCVHSHVGVSLVDASGKLRPCCKFKSGWNIPTIFDVDTLDNLHTRSEYTLLQSALSGDEWPTPCRVCERSESTGIESRRQFTNNMYTEHDLYQSGYIQDLEISLDYTCNMMCRMCAPAASSKWGAAKSVIEKFNTAGIELDTHTEYKSYQDQFYKVFSNTDLSHARHVKLEGGEPFYAKHLEWFIDKLDREVINKEKLFLNITTNGSVYPNEALLEKLAKFDTTIAFSIDAYGDLANCLRWGVEWDLIESNIRKWMQHSEQFNLFTNITVSILNVNMMSPLIRFCKDIGLRMSFSELTHPEYLSMYQLPLELRKHWANGVSNFDELLLADIYFEPQFKKLLTSANILNNYQGIDFALVNSEMTGIINACIM